jgi:hypothetical protein
MKNVKYDQSINENASEHIRGRMTKNTDNKYDGLKRPTVPLTTDEHKKIARFCIDNDMKIGEFLRRAGLYCVENGIKF